MNNCIKVAIFFLELSEFCSYTSFVNKKHKQRVDLNIFSNTFENLCQSTRLLQTREYTHHFGTSLLRHCVNVAYVSLYLADLLHLNVDRFQLTTGALLHDYYLYDCHDDNEANKKHHLRHHASIAAMAAKEEYSLTKKEEDIILKHMFPINLALPKFKESALVCVSDKICALYECVSNIYKFKIRCRIFARKLARAALPLPACNIN